MLMATPHLLSIALPAEAVLELLTPQKHSKCKLEFLKSAHSSRMTAAQHPSIQQCSHTLCGVWMGDSMSRSVMGNSRPFRLRSS